VLFKEKRVKETAVKLTLIADCGEFWPTVKTAPQFQLVLGTYEKVRRYRKEMRAYKPIKPAFKWVLCDQWL